MVDTLLVERIKVGTDPTSPVQLSEVKTYLREEYGTDTNEDALITALIDSAVTDLERYSGLTFMPNEYHLWFNSLDERFEIPYGPIQSAAGVKLFTIDLGNTETELTQDENFWVSGIKFLQIFYPHWLVGNRYRIQYTPGYTDSASVPELIKTAIKQKVAYLYFNRSDEGLVKVRDFDLSIQTIYPLARNL